MGDLQIKANLVEEQLWPKKPTLIKPIPLRAQAKVPTSACSSFQSWQKHSKSLHKLATIPENDTHLIEENTTNGGGATFGDANDQNTANEALANIEQEMEKKHRRIISNRYSARRSRLKKIAYMKELENRMKSYKVIRINR